MKRASATTKPGRTGLIAATLLLGLLAGLILAGRAASGRGTLKGRVNVDGSSTVFPITQALAEEFNREEPSVRISVGVSGTGGGFEKFCRGEIDIADASRRIKDSEREACAEAGIRFLELTVAMDGLSVVVHPDNDFVDCLTVEELRRIWEPGSTVENWSQVRDGFPNRPLRLYGPGTDSGTFDYFTDEIVGEEGASRDDYTASEDDNVLVQGISGDEGALGYFGFAYYEENASKLRLVGVDGGDGCVKPTPEFITTGTYTPLSRPLFVYVAQESTRRPELRAFVDFYLRNANSLVRDVGYIPVPQDVAGEQLAQWESFAHPAEGGTP